MKLKEFPGSIWRAWQLNRISIRSLHNKSATSLPVIVSFTSIPSRFDVIHLTVRSILAGTHKPDKIVLWLNELLKSSVPESLLKIVGEKFEIRYVEGNLPHRKLIHSLQAFPDKILVTCDDDMMYDSSWLNLLYQDHINHPLDIIANECRGINYDETGNLRPYYFWYKENKENVSYDSLLPLGFGGVLYPPKCLHDDVFQADLYLKLAPKADDLWFKAMAILRGTAARHASQVVAKPTPIFNSQSVSLKATNVKQDGNRLQWEAIANHYRLPAFAPLQLQKNND